MCVVRVRVRAHVCMFAFSDFAIILACFFGYGFDICLEYSLSDLVRRFKNPHLVFLLQLVCTDEGNNVQWSDRCVQEDLGSGSIAWVLSWLAG